MELLRKVKEDIDFDNNKNKIKALLESKVNVEDKAQCTVYISLYLKKKTSPSLLNLEDKDLLNTLSSLLYFCLFEDNETSEIVDYYLQKANLDTDQSVLGHLITVIDLCFENEIKNADRLMVESLFNEFMKAVQSEIALIHSRNRLVRSNKEFSESRLRIDIVSNGEQLKKDFKKAEKVLKLLNDEEEQEKIKQYLTIRIQHLIQGVFQ
jgi:hypothetical protein